MVSYYPSQKFVAVELPEKQGLKHIGTVTIGDVYNVAVELPEKQGLKPVSRMCFPTVFPVAVELPEKQGLKHISDHETGCFCTGCSGTSRKTRIETYYAKTKL